MVLGDEEPTVTERPAELRIDAPYPYVVVRWMPAVYGRRAVVFDTEASDARRPLPRDVVRVVDPCPYVEGRLSRRARRAVVLHVLAQSAESGFHMCCVFGPDDAVYCSPDGKVSRNRAPPSGGARFDDVEVRRKPRTRH